MAKGYIACFLGGKGGVGKSMLAANFAFAFAAESRSKTLLLDFDSKAGGDQNIITGMTSKKNIKELGDFPGAIDVRALQQFVISHPAGVSYIGMPNDPMAAAAVNADGLGKTLKAVTEMFPLIVIDCGSELNDLSLKALEFATAIFLVCSADVLALNQSKRIYSELVTMLFPKDMIQVLVNQAVQGHPVSPDVVGKTIGKPVFSTILKDDQTCVQALNAKKPIVTVAKNSPFAKGVFETVRKVIQKNVFQSLAKLQKSPDAGKQKKGSVGDEKKAKNAWIDLKIRIHKSLVEEMDLSKDDDKDPKAKIILKEQTKKLVVDLLGKEDTSGVINTRDDMNQMVKEILDEALGLGPLEDMLSNKSISEIMVVGPEKIFYEEGGKIKKSEVIFSSDRQVLNVIERIVAPIGRRIDEKTPYVDARLSDGSRVHAIIPPCALNGGTITIRKFPENRLTYKDLVKFGSVTQNMADFLRISVEAHRNIVVSGGTGSGKTSLINILGSFIQANERVITCEDSAELDFPQDHVVSLETKPASLEGEGGVDIRCLVKQTLRMRPDRIVIGECRGGETLD
ncbi:MAG: ATPase, T2SS/T4P/T4SS family, partial [Bdellovibrionales bacterium]|nr:ATPase, T2SS/T4P/T4SS family [Bdellovibrionales bacterium]